MFAFVYSSRFSDVSYGLGHPFKIQRYRLCFELIGSLGLLGGDGVRLIEARPASEADLLSFHRRDYLERLIEFSADDGPRADFVYGLGDVENPVFAGLYDWAALVCGGTVEAMHQILEHGCRGAFNMAGGWHHAHAARASGFSYLNDAVVAINCALRAGLRVAYVDIDAHHGDGVQEAFYASDRVLTISVHETGDDFFPHTGYSRETGSGRGEGFAINVPLQRHADDRLFLRAFDEVVMPALTAFHPDVLVTQMGADGLRTDPLARLELTTSALEYAAHAFSACDIPWVALGGGGYDELNVARSWALVWGAMRRVSIPDRLPEGFRSCLPGGDDNDGRLRDLPHQALPDDFARATAALDGQLDYLRKHLPLLGGARKGRR